MANLSSNRSLSLKRIKKIGCSIVSILGLVILLVFLGLISSTTTVTSLWDGFFPAGEFHIKIEDGQGHPIQGALLNVFDHKTRELAVQYPVDNYLSQDSLVSNELGLIVVTHLPQGYEFGGSCFKLFWVYPMCSSSTPKYDFKVSAAGYKTLVFSTRDLFGPAYEDRSSGTASITVDTDKTLEIPVYELTFRLEKIR